MKKKFTEKTGKFSYLLKRACRFCSAPIHDKAHGASEFCPKTWDDNGKVRDCKTAYHRENDKPEREIQAEYSGRNKAIKSRIEFLVKKHGDQITTEMLDTYEIMLTECIKYQVDPSGTLTTHFLNYQIVSNPFNNIHKITYHD
jgi:hypothetical protein